MSAARKPTKHSENRILIPNNQVTPRVCPELAEEIGLNESMMLLQIEFWLSISNNQRDGRKWVWKSVRDIKKEIFPFWSISTINRIIQKLESKKLITVANYNTRANDETRWFTINPIECSKLQSITVEGLTRLNIDPFQNDTACFNMTQGAFQNDTAPFQNETTLPENTPENTTESTSTSTSTDVDALYQAYPRHVGKAAALKAAVNAVERVARGGTRPDGEAGPWPPPNPVEYLLARVEAYAMQCKLDGKEMKYIKHPATWFNQECYLDEPEKSSKAVPVLMDTYSRMQARCSKFANKGAVCH